MGLTKHLHELEELEQIKLIIRERKRAYALVTEKAFVENLINDDLMKYVGFCTTYRILEAGSRGDKELHIEEFYDARKFIDDFMIKTYNLADVNYEALFKAFKKKYGEPTI